MHALSSHTSIVSLPIHVQALIRINGRLAWSVASIKSLLNGQPESQTHNSTSQVRGVK